MRSKTLLVIVRLGFVLGLCVRVRARVMVIVRFRVRVRARVRSWTLLVMCWQNNTIPVD